ncbi:MAG: sugar phosphate nucleotidyltransferase [Desulfobacterales bacterium]|jgi:NDP-sugar pyrophosphorylase family protein/tRNA A-37 threonylcarbamoyl transferase component Bud32|nr:sugar phosphate nucleotidyltransferase [Desulfobacterales bacterium]
MKALILAAGFGTRLRPYTVNTPKPLFTIDGQALLDRIICQLYQAGCSDIIVNTHHLSHQIEAHLANRTYPVPVGTRYEPVVLGTGGAIRSAADFWDDTPFMVINSDIVTDIDLRGVYEFHCRHHTPATLVLTDAPAFNTVVIDDHDRIVEFTENEDGDPPIEKYRRLTFTGIQVLDSAVIQLIPNAPFVNSIDVYRRLISRKTPPKAFIAVNQQWEDIGTVERYRKIARNVTAARAFQTVFGEKPKPPIQQTLLAGDGSDRTWHRLRAGTHSLVMADHGIRNQAPPAEIDSFVSIGSHLYEKKVPVPRIFRYDSFSGMVFLEDLGDTHLQAYIRNLAAPEKIESAYRTVIDHLIHLSLAGKQGFDTSWTYQTAAYDKPLVLERECRYFVEAFLNGHMHLDCRFENLQSEFAYLADNALRYSVSGLLHRDFQSRNIMVHNGRFYIIDFQGARLGPIQYDLASLLIDPYVELSVPLQNALLNYAVEALSTRASIEPEAFRQGYRFCRITRNLQILGAFGFLNGVKQKPYFAQYIPAALRSLNQGLSQLDPAPLIQLNQLIQTIMSREPSRE